MNINKMKIDELVRLIEDPTQGNPADKERAFNELKKWELEDDVLNELITKTNEAIAYERIMNEDITNTDVSIHESRFLNEEEMREIYINQLDKFIKYKNQFRFDVWSYAIGGV